MNEIEKMYENCGIEKGCLHSKDCRHKGICRDFASCEHYCYPSFTAEKQLELIKWLVDKQMISIIKNIVGYEIFTPDRYIDVADDEFSEAIAKFINRIWQDLTDEEKQQIKEILSD